jgi:GT2 family glycosyltransferase
MGLTVILVNWRDEKQTLRCVHAVKSWQALKPELLVIDNQSTEATCKTLAAALAPDKLICSPVNLGYGGGNNLGIRRALAAEEKYILLLNSDAEISEEGVSRLLKRLQTNPEISILGPVIHEERDGVTQCLVGGRDIARYPSTRIAVQPGEVKTLPGYPLHEVGYVSGTVFLARCRVFAEIGLLDERYFFSGEIADFCKRARDRGHKVCVDLEVEARHDIGRTPPHIRETLYVYYSLRNRLLYARKHHASEKLRYFTHWAIAGGLELASAIKDWKMAKARAIFLALAHAYTNRYGDQNAKFS